MSEVSFVSNFLLCPIMWHKEGVIETVRTICGKTNYHIQGVFVANVDLVAG